jgi:hypothetical protein
MIVCRVKGLKPFEIKFGEYHSKRLKLMTDTYYVMIKYVPCIIYTFYMLINSLIWIFAVMHGHIC